jgi:hypothetical protein
MYLDLILEVSTTNTLLFCRFPSCTWNGILSLLSENEFKYIFLRRIRKNADLLLYHRTDIFSLLFIQQMGTDEISFNNEVNVGSKCGGRSQVHLSISGQPNNWMSR